MSQYIILVYKKRDVYDRFFLKRSTLEEAKECARTQTEDGIYGAEIYEAHFITSY